MTRALVLALLLAGCAHVREASVLVPLAVGAPLVLLDASTTRHVCRSHSCQELNPLNAPFVRSRWLFAVNVVEYAAWIAVWDAVSHQRRGVLRHAWVGGLALGLAASYAGWRSGVVLHRQMEARP